MCRTRGLVDTARTTEITAQLSAREGGFPTSSASRRSYLRLHPRHGQESPQSRWWMGPRPHPRLPGASSRSGAAMSKKVLVVGSGAREHALSLRLLESPLVGHVLVAPGNAGSARLPGYLAG